MDLLGLYPLSKPDGDPIPYDVIRPLGLFSSAFTDSVAGPFAIPATPPDVTLSVFATSDCIIGLDTTAAHVLDGSFQANMALIPGNTFMNIDHNGAANLTVVGIREGGGLLIVMISKKWQDTKKASLFERG